MKNILERVGRSVFSAFAIATLVGGLFGSAGTALAVAIDYTPVITILGSNPATVQVGDIYVDEGATAVDGFGTPISDSIVTTGLPVDTSSPGSFIVTYEVTVTDGEENPISDSETRTVNVVAVPNPTTVDATGVTSLDATLNGTNGPLVGTGHSFWVSLDTFATDSPSIPSEVYSTPDLGPVGADEDFSAALSSVTTSGVPSNMPAITPDTDYYFAAWSLVDGTWYPGEILTLHTAPIPDCAPGSSSFDDLSLGNVNGQGDWSSTGSYDQEIVENVYGYSEFGCQSLRISNAVTSGSFGDQTISPSNVDEAGETSATNSGFSGGTRQNHFEAEFSFASTLFAQQPGLAISASPDRGDGSRMSYLRFVDDVSGIDVYFDDVVTEDNPADFHEVLVADDLSRETSHTAKFVIDFLEGPSNDIAQIYIDGDLVYTGTTWENYYRFDSEASAEQNPRTIDSMIFLARGGAAPANEDNGYLFDNVDLSSSAFTPATLTIVKHIDGEVGEGENFDFSVNGIEENGFQHSLTLDTNDMSTSSDITSEPISLIAGTYDVLEDAPYGWNLADVQCVYDGESVGITAQEGEQITVDDGDEVTCTFTNTTRATLIVKKVVINDNGGTATAGDFSFQYSFAESFTDPIAFIEQENPLLGENHITVDEGGYIVTEPAVAGYTTTYEDCDGMELNNLEESTCVITNDDIAVPPGDGGNNGGGDGSNNLGRTDDNNTGGEVLGASTSTDSGSVLGSVCELPLTTYLRRGRANNAQNVMDLQNFLNQEMGINPPIPATGFFGPITEAAVKAFQIKYYDEVLKPWVDLGLLPANTATGIVYKMTLWKIQDIGCPSLNTPKPIIP